MNHGAGIPVLPPRQSKCINFSTNVTYLLTRSVYICILHGAVSQAPCYPLLKDHRHDKPRAHRTVPTSHARKPRPHRQLGALHPPLKPVLRNSPQISTRRGDRTNPRPPAQASLTQPLPQTIHRREPSGGPLSNSPISSTNWRSCKSKPPTPPLRPRLARPPSHSPPLPRSPAAGVLPQTPGSVSRFRRGHDGLPPALAGIVSRPARVTLPW
jgi:hypothetical protein